MEVWHCAPNGYQSSRLDADSKYVSLPPKIRSHDQELDNYPPPEARPADRVYALRDSDIEHNIDLDLHQTFGSFLTRKNPISPSTSPEIAAYWDLLCQSPARLQQHTHVISDKYRAAFRSFFTAEPISLHGHVSDASNTALLTSLISHLSARACCTDSDSDSDAETKFFTSEAKTNPRIAVTEHSYGAGYGCLAYHAVLDSARQLANGPRPFIVKTNNAGKIAAQIRKAKSEGCIALITEIVRAADGKPISSSAWKAIVQACGRYNLILIVDEALTSIRCGAPFACQLEQYAQHGYPDLILFGKAVRTNGIAIDWRGVNIRKLEIDTEEERRFTILEWQERLTEMAQAADLLISWGTLVLAQRERWPERAREVGEVLRGILRDEGVKIGNVAGLHALLYLRREDVRRLRSPVMGAHAGNFVRWFPVLDEMMSEEGELRRKVFGKGSIAHRRELAAYLRSPGLQLRF